MLAKLSTKNLLPVKEGGYMNRQKLFYFTSVALGERTVLEISQPKENPTSTRMFRYKRSFI